MVRDYDPTNNYNNLLDRVIRHRDAIISHLNWVCIFLGFHSFGLYIHNDTMSALGRPQDMFSDTAIQLQPVFAQWIQHTHFTAPGFSAPNALAPTSLTWGGDVVAVGGKVAMMPISLGTADFLVWLMLDQVKLRYMLEQPAYFFYKYKLTSPYLSNKIFKTFNRFNFWAEIWQNLVRKVNQQETSYLLCSAQNNINQEGSSETTREAVKQKIQDFDFSDYAKHKPEHIKNLDTDFLMWFIGFFEGDGSWSIRLIEQNSTKISKEVVLDKGSINADNSLNEFQVSLNNKYRLRLHFEIAQNANNIKLIKKIRTQLGFGRVQEFTKNGFHYCKFEVSTRENIIKLFHLLNGNLILEKRREQLATIHQAMVFYWGVNFPLKPCRNKVSLENAWLAGFTDADAGFFVNTKTEFRGSKRPASRDGYYTRFLCKYYITQDGEKAFLIRLAALTGATKPLAKITNGKTKKLYNRLELTDPQHLEVLILYFSKYPLKGCKKIDALRWARVFGYKKQQRVLTEKARAKLAATF